MYTYDETQGKYGTFVFSVDEYKRLREIVSGLPNVNAPFVEVKPSSLKALCELCDAI